MPPDRVWVKNLAWRQILSEFPKRCHWGRGACERTADFELNRTLGGGKPRWTAYCSQHVREFGLQIEHGEVLVSVANGSPAAIRGWTS